MKNKKIILLISVITIISFIIGFSYAYFTTIVVGNDTASSNVMISGTLRLTYNGTDFIDMANKEPGDYDTMTFTVKNTGTLPVTGYDIYFSNVINTFYTKSELVYEIDCTSSDAVPCLDKVETEVPSVSGIVLSQTDIAPGTTHTYVLTLTFTDTGLNQDYNQGKTILFDVTINEQYDIPVLVASTGTADARYFWGYKTSITSVTFEKGIDVPGTAAASWDVSAAQDGSIMAYIMGSGTYDLYFQTDSDFLLSNPNSSYLFYNFTSLTAINNLSMFRTYYVTNMSGMFRVCSSLTSLNLSYFETSSVTNMFEMFRNCGVLSTLNISTFDTSSVTNMAEMFAFGIPGDLDLFNFDTSNVITMDSMFMGLYTDVLNISSFDTANVTDISQMFASTDFTTLDLSHFDTSKVTQMDSLFAFSSTLTSVNLSSFDTSLVTTMGAMFWGCSGLTSIDFRLANFTTVTTYSSMFSGITSGITITVLDSTAQTWITARLTDAGETGTVVIA